MLELKEWLVAPEPKEKYNLVQGVVESLKGRIFDFQLLPGDRFTENEVARDLDVSRTPVREALFQLQREGFVEVHFRSGWQVKALDFQNLEELYDLRIILERAAVERLGKSPERGGWLERMSQLWPLDGRVLESDAVSLARQDEAFHHALVETMGNSEVLSVHHGITERIRIIRRLDFSLEERVLATYREHGALLGLLERGDTEEATVLLEQHINDSRNKVRDITLHRLYQARKDRNPEGTIQ